jgi:anti-sigma regulatory factor (Ser/Thr protein kinase)
MMTASTGTRPFDHPALLYRDDDEYLAGTVPFIRGGLAAGQPVMVAVPGASLDLIRDALGTGADRVTWNDMTVAGRNPGRIIPAVLLRFAEDHPGERVRIIGEPIWAGRTALEYPACAQHEALINAAFDGRDAEILCPYDVSRLAPEVIDDAYRTHPVLATPSGRSASPEYRDPMAAANLFNLPLPDPPVSATTVTIDRQSLSGLRRFVSDHAARAGLSPERAAELTIAVNELATNTVEHADGSGTLSVWVENGYVVCQLHDSGYLVNLLAGRVPPAPASLGGGRGLVLVNHLCDLVRMYTRLGSTTIRVHTNL